MNFIPIAAHDPQAKHHFLYQYIRKFLALSQLLPNLDKSQNMVFFYYGLNKDIKSHESCKRFPETMEIAIEQAKKCL